MLVIKELSLLEASLKWATHPRIMLEVTLIKLCESDFSLAGNDMLGRLSALEKKISSGDFAVKAAAPKADVESNQLKNEDTEKKAVKKVSPENNKAATNTASPSNNIANWPEIIDELKKRRKMALHTYLLDTTAVELDSKFIAVIFKIGNGFARINVAKAENLEVVEALASEKLGRPIRIKCVEEDDFKIRSKEAQVKEKDEFIEKAQDIAKRFNAPLNVIDE